MGVGFDLAEVEAGLRGSLFAGAVRHFESVGSTNSLALEAAGAGVGVGVWVADEQTAGRGRGGHTWESAAGDGLYVSVLMRPKLRGVDVLKVSLAAGVACAVAIDKASCALISLKWPNDLMEGKAGMGGRKLGGILTETAMGGDGELQYAVVGIGINLNQSAMPEELAEIATSLRESWHVGETRREVLLPILLKELEREVAAVEAEARGEEERVCERFGDWSFMVRGLAVRVEEEGGYTGVTDGLEETGLLRVLDDAGRVRIVRHGGVRAI